MTTIITYNLNKEEFEAAIASKLSDLTKENAFSRFSGRLVTINTVAEIHSVHRDTVVRHVEAGNIPYLKEGSKIYFDMADVLQFDFTKLRKRIN